MKRKISAISLLCLFLSLTSVNEGNAAYLTQDYFPIQVGNTWSYTYNYTMTIAGTEVVDGITTFKWQDVNNPSSYGLLTNDSAGFRIYAGDGELITPPLTIVAATFNVGDVFIASGTMGIENLTVTHEILGFENQTVSAFSGESLKVGVSIDLLYGADYTEEIWLAQGIGLIKVINYNTIDEGFLWGLNNELLSYQVAPVPIPGAAWLLCSGLVCLAGFRRRFKKA